MRRAALALGLALAAAVDGSASGPLGVYGIVERVVFEPNEQTPERIQVWGAFMYVDGETPGGLGVSTATRGYLYFRLPTPGIPGQAAEQTVRNEWRDLKAVAGTGQAVGFGSWGYIGRFEALQPDRATATPPYVLERRAQGGERTDLRVRRAGEQPSAPAAYQTNTGVVQLSDRGSHADIVRRLREALK